MDNIKLWEVLVPRVRNNGKPYTTRHHRQWDQQVIRITGGLTVLRPTTVGYWMDQRTTERSASEQFPEGDQNLVYKDSMIPVRIACTDRQMKEILRRTLVHYDDQEAIMAYVISNEVVFASREKENAYRQ